MTSPLDGVRVLDLGGELAAYGTKILAVRWVPVKPGVSVVACNAAANLMTPSPGPSPSKYSIYAIAPVAPTMEKFSAATGKAIGVIYRSPSRSTQPAYWVAWSNPDGSVLVIDAPIRTALHAPSRFGVVRNGRFTPLPGTRSLIPEFNTLAF